MKSSNLRFLLSLGNTKMIVLRDENDLYIYADQSKKADPKSTIKAQRITEALLSK